MSAWIRIILALCLVVVCGSVRFGTWPISMAAHPGIAKRSLTFPNADIETDIEADIEADIETDIEADIETDSALAIRSVDPSPAPLNVALQTALDGRRIAGHLAWSNTQGWLASPMTLHPLGLVRCQRDRILSDRLSTSVFEAVRIRAEADVTGALHRGSWVSRCLPLDLRQGRLRRPVRGSVAAPFGPVQHSNTFTYVRHPGVTYRVAPGTEVHAIARGIVRYLGELYGYGGVVIVDHSWGYHSVYGHLAEWEVVLGDTVESGAVLGRTDRSTTQGDTLYLEIRYMGEPLDPALWIGIPTPN